MKYVLFIFVCYLRLLSFSQVDLEVSDKISDCSGSSNIMNSGTYKLQFTGKSGIVEDFSAYPSLDKNLEKNSLWLSYIAPFHGRLTIDAITNSETPIQMLIFESEGKDICTEISKGKAEIKRLILSNGNHVGLNLVTSDEVLYPVDLETGKHIMICLLAPVKSKNIVEFALEFTPMDGEVHETSEGGKLIDLRDDKAESGLNVMIRDAETGLPVVANVTVTGIKSLLGTMNASDLLMTVDKSGKINFKVDAEGYFFVDREEPVSQGSDNEVVIWLEPLGEGKSMQIDEIEFTPGTSEFLPTADTKLRRLKDFLVLNSNVKIEIQGHVHSTGENTFAAQKLSEARAKRVLNYLVENGISKDRMEAIGFGNTKPIYPEAKFSYEEQSNRRVEIKVL